MNFKKPSHADDSDLTDDDVIIRYERGQVVGMTFLNASKRHKLNALLATFNRWITTQTNSVPVLNDFPIQATKPRPDGLLSTRARLAPHAGARGRAAPPPGSAREREARLEGKGEML